MDLLQGTLDILILKAVSLGPLHGYGILLRIQQISKGRLEFSKVRCIQRCVAWNTRAGLRANGENPKASARRNTTASLRQEDAASRAKPKSGIAWRM